MTGPEHYKEAETLLSRAQVADDNARPSCRYADLVAEAQVHATLALAAATVSVERAIPPSPPEWDGGPAYPGNEWGRAIGSPA